MRKITILLLFISFNSIAQVDEKLSIGFSFAHFNDTDGFEVNTAYYHSINRYLAFDITMSYAHTSDFPHKYKFTELMDEMYWFTNSIIFNMAPNLHLVFINAKRHHFSLYSGIGLMHINAADNTFQPFDSQNFAYESTIESYPTASYTIGIKYIFYIKNYGLGINAKSISPIKRSDYYFGQDNFRALGISLTKRFN